MFCARNPLNSREYLSHDSHVATYTATATPASPARNRLTPGAAGPRALRRASVAPRLSMVPIPPESSPKPPQFQAKR